MNKYARAFWLITFSTILLCFISAFTTPRTDFRFITKSEETIAQMNKGEFEILLGQTKYYQAIINRNRLVIVESTEPELQGSESDVTFEVTGETRDTLGVYYDNKDEQGNDLPLGMIRLIGLYWDGGKPFKVRLTAKKRCSSLFADIGYTLSQLAEMRESYDVASVVIDVKAPSLLGTTSSSVTDCFGNSVDIDELIIKYAGENGIPPQLIKGQMEQETNFKNVWRYEPHMDYGYQKTNNKTVFPTGAPFWKTVADPKGDSWPNLHTNVSPSAYNDKVVSIGAYMAGDDNSFSKYRNLGETVDNDKIMYFNNLTKELKSIVTKFQEDTTITITRKMVYDSLASEIKDTSTNLGKDLSKIAQTRIVSSYGYVQMMYYTATSTSFGSETNGRYGSGCYMDRMNKTVYPEKLNEIEYAMPRYCDYFLRHLHLLFGTSIPNSQWKITNRKIKIEGVWRTFNADGFEDCWKNALQLHNYNKKDYGSDVMEKSKKYLPQ